MYRPRYYHYPKDVLMQLLSDKLKEIHKLQNKGYIPAYATDRLTQLATEIYYVRQAIAMHEQQGRVL